MSEKNIQNECLLAVGQMADVMIWRNHTGKYRHISDPKTIIIVGTNGAPDALGVVAGRAIGVEFKTHTGRQSDAQKAWQAAFTVRGGRYALVRSVADMLAFIDEVRRSV
jgi:hypothetical protein